eukprot:scaffold52298_cov39-Tisochrysis_lutea.AAC.1
MEEESPRKRVRERGSFCNFSLSLTVSLNDPIYLHYMSFAGSYFSLEGWLMQVHFMTSLLRLCGMRAPDSECIMLCLVDDTCVLWNYGVGARLSRLEVTA